MVKKPHDLLIVAWPLRFFNPVAANGPVAVKILPHFDTVFIDNCRQQARSVAFSLVKDTDAIVPAVLSAFTAIITAGRQHLKDGTLIEMIGK